MTADNCLFHGSRDCPASRELDDLDWQINQRLHAEKIIRETRDALKELLGEIRDNALNPAHTMTKFGLEQVTDANRAISDRALKEIQG